MLTDKSEQRVGEAGRGWNKVGRRMTQSWKGDNIGSSGTCKFLISVCSLIPVLNPCRLAPVISWCRSKYIQQAALGLTQSTGTNVPLSQKGLQRLTQPQRVKFRHSCAIRSSFCFFHPMLLSKQRDNHVEEPITRFWTKNLSEVSILKSRKQR